MQFEPLNITKKPLQLKQLQFLLTEPRREEARIPRAKEPVEQEYPIKSEGMGFMKID